MQTALLLLNVYHLLSRTTEVGFLVFFREDSSLLCTNLHLFRWNAGKLCVVPHQLMRGQTHPFFAPQPLRLELVNRASRLSEHGLAHLGLRVGGGQFIFAGHGVVAHSELNIGKTL